MIYFLLGIAIGLLDAVLTFILLIYFRKPIEQKLQNFYQTITDIPLHAEKGKLIEPESDVEETQNRIIQENRKAGRNTYLADITPE